MPTEYYLDDSLSRMVTTLVDDPIHTEFEPLRSHETGFLVAGVRKTNTEGETLPMTGAAVKVRKIGPADSVFLPGYQIKVYVDMHRWEACNDRQRHAMMHDGLMRVSAELKESGVKYAMRRPDVETFQATIVRYGAWNDSLLLFRENLENAKKKASEIREESLAEKE